jgi:ABC-type glutathione transport system ATPase component
MNDEPLVHIRGLTKRYARRGACGRPPVEALAGVDLTIERGTVLALVGQSGSGKSTLARCLARLEEPTAGEMRFEGEDVSLLEGAALRAFRERVQLLFQDSAAALSPRLTAAEIVSEPLEILGRGGRATWRGQALELMETVGLSSALADRRPLDLSGGQRQRLAIARALAVKPRLLILDEAFAGLDVSIQAQVAATLHELRLKEGLTYLCISHDLALMSVFADEIAILFEGRIVERAAAAQLFAAPVHPQTRALVAAVPSLPPLAEAAATS